MRWFVLCDFDGTIATVDTTDVLLEAFALPAWEQLEARWKAGEIGSRDCMRGQVELIRATLPDIDRLADSITLEPDFKDFVDYCGRQHVPMTIVSDGIDYIIRRILTKHGLGWLPVVANRLVPLTTETYTLESPYKSVGCKSGTCKCAVEKQINETLPTSSCLYIGDGRSDFCVSENRADFVLAKSSLLTYCQQKAVPHHAFTNFTNAVGELARLRAITDTVINTQHTQEANL